MTLVPVPMYASSRLQATVAPKGRGAMPNLARGRVPDAYLAGGAEDGVLSLHMAQIADRLPLEVLDMIAGEAEYNRPRQIRSPEELAYRDLLSPEKLYERSCRTDPHPDAFQMWLNWSRKHRNWQAANGVAELWREYGQAGHSWPGPAPLLAAPTMLGTGRMLSDFRLLRKISID